jgi:hypothetical protein
MGVGLSFMPGMLKDALLSFVARLHFGNLTRYNFRQPEWFVFKDDRIPMIDVGFVEYLKKGLIEIRPNVMEFAEKGVVFYDNHPPENYDEVIAATGFQTGLENILEIPDVLDEHGYLTVPCGEPNHHQGLWFIGFISSPAGVLLMTRIHARKMAKYIAEQHAVSN